MLFPAARLDAALPTWIIQRRVIRAYVHCAHPVQFVCRNDMCVGVVALNDNEKAASDLVHAERGVREAEVCVGVQAALVDLFKREGHKEAFFSALTMLDTVRDEREAARGWLRTCREAQSRLHG